MERHGGARQCKGQELELDPEVDRKPVKIIEKGHDVTSVLREINALGKTLDGDERTKISQGTGDQWVGGDLVNR